MNYLEQITIGVLIRIDSPARKSNLLVLLRYLSQYGLKVHVWDSGCERCVLPKEVNDKIDYTYEWDDNPIYHRTRYINRLLKTVNTPTVAIWDADLILPISQLELSIQAIIEQGFVLSIPYNGVMKMLSETQSEAFEHAGKGSDYLSMHVDTYVRALGRPSCGGAFVVNRVKYLGCGGDNEHFISWGPEDAERIRRMKILGHSIHWVNEGPSFHLWHPRGINSGYATEELAFKNRMEFVKVCSMKQQELSEYVDSWRKEKQNG